MLPEFGPGEAQEQQATLLPGVRPYGARSDESVLVGDLLMRHVPALARGDLEIVAIARHQGVLSKVAVRRRRGIRLSARPVSLVVGLGADYVNRVSAELGGERLHVLQWQGDPARYVADALGLGYLPPIELSPSTRLANVLLGDIDVRGIRGLSMYGLSGLLPIGQVTGVRRSTPAETVDGLLRERLGHELRVDVLRLDADTGQIIVSERRAGGRQLSLF